MDTVRQIAEGKKPFGPFARRYGVRAVVLKITRKSAYLAKFLYLSPQWRLRSLGARTVVFASTTADPSAPMMIDEESLAEKLRAMDPMPVYPLQAAARTLQLMEFYDLSIQMGRRAIEADSEYKGLWDVLGVSYAIRGKRKRSQRIAGAHEDFQQAKQCFVEALKRDPESRQLAAKLRQAELDLKKIDR
jgi:tetratricopeptide (TPR) repeat protein